MEELRLSPKDLKNVIDNEKVIGQGHFGIVISYKDKLLKLDKYLLSKLRENSSFYSKMIVENYYKNDLEDFDNIKQIEYLSSIRDNVYLTKLPLGIVMLKDVDSNLLNVSTGIIIPYHKGYDKLENISLSNQKNILIFLKKLLLALKELEDNKISHEDLVSYGEECIIEKRKYNVLCKDNTPEIIDIDGFFVKAGDEFISSCNMYREYCNILLDYFSLYHIKSNMVRGKITSFLESAELLKRLEYEMKKK